MNAMIVAFSAQLTAIRSRLPDDDAGYQLRVGIARVLRELEALQLRALKYQRDDAAKTKPAAKSVK